MFNNQAPSSSCHTYEKHHPIYVLGLTPEQLSKMRRAYVEHPGAFNVGFYDMLDYDKLVERVGIKPSVVVLAEHIQIVGSINEFLKRNKTPVLRVMENPVPAARLPPEYFYNGVYDTLAEPDLYIASRLNFHINLGVMIWSKNKEAQTKQAQAQRVDTVNLYDPRGSKFRKRMSVPQPEQEWSLFVRKYVSNIPSRFVKALPGLSGHEHIGSVPL